MVRLDQVIGIGLAVGSGLLAISAGLLFSGIGSSIDSSEVEQIEAGEIRPSSAVGYEAPELLAYNEIRDRPLFNENRRPIIDEEEVPEEEPDSGKGELDSVDLEVAINGIIITPSVRIALVTDKKSNKRIRLKEGTPMTGEMAEWTLASIEPRKVVFENEFGSAEEIELEVNKKALKGGPPPAPIRRQQSARAAQGQSTNAENANNANAAEGDDVERQRRAEEIRKRVAERRAQLRAEAARRREQQQNGGELQEDEES